MRAFRTIINPDKAPFSISYNDKIVSIGSCFSENIGKKFRDYKFSININPFGQQYNPVSVANAIERLLTGTPYTEADLVFHDELYHSFDHHGSYSRSHKEEALELINSNLEKASADSKTASVLFLTFGTSHVFRLKKDNKVVSNCHKLSGSYFTTDLLKCDEIAGRIHGAIQKLRKMNPSIQIILTVSPVRYFAFGHYENSVSKAQLFVAINELLNLNKGYVYFPAYELVMDDLRDYRFFAEDMLHPNYQATDYVWEKLCGSMLEKKTLAVMAELDEILLAARHKPRNPQSEAHKKFVKKNLAHIKRLQAEFPFDFGEEEKHLNSFL